MTSADRRARQGLGKLWAGNCPEEWSGFTVNRPSGGLLPPLVDQRSWGTSVRKPSLSGFGDGGVFARSL